MLQKPLLTATGVHKAQQIMNTNVHLFKCGFLFYSFAVAV